MMTHLDEHTLNEYLDGMLAAAEKQAVAAHLATCTDCRQTYTDLQALFLALDEVAEVELQTDLSARVLADWRAQSQPEANPWLRPLLFLELAGAVAMLVWLWPVFGRWLAGVETAVAATFSALQPIQLNLWGRWLAWETAVIQQFQLARPTFDLAAGQWALLVSLALLVWLAGNRLLFTNEQ